MDNYLIRYNRIYFVADWQDICESIGNIAFGLLNIGFGKTIKVAHLFADTNQPRQHFFEEAAQSKHKRVAAIACVIFLPLTALLAMVGCVAYTFSESRKYIRLCHEANINKTLEPNVALFPRVCWQLNHYHY